MSVNFDEYKPPYPEAERIFTEADDGGIGIVPVQYKDRAFLVYTDRAGMGYWLKSPSGSVYSGMDNRDGAHVFDWEHCSEWAYNRTRIEMLPLPVTMTEPTESTGDIKWGELGKVATHRLCIVKNKDGKYIDGNLKEVEERKLATIHKCIKLYGLDLMKPFTFELLKPVDAETGGPEMQEVICYAEAMRQEDKARFLVKFVKPCEVTGYTYYPKTRRASASVLEKKEVRRLFDSVPKAEIVIELLKPMKVSKLEDFFNASALQLIQASPKNEHVRAFMLSKLKVMPPVEADTMEKIREWVEWNVAKKRAAELSFEPLTAPATVEAVSMEIVIRRRRTQYGSARYEVRQSGTQNVQLTMASIRSAVEFCSNWSQFRNYLKDVAGGTENTVRYEDETSKVYLDHEDDEQDRHEVVWTAVSTADDTIKRFLRQHMPDALRKYNVQ